MNQLIEFLITSSVLILLVIIIRACFMGKVKNSIIYALWLVVLVRLICPVNFFESSFSVMNGVETVQNSMVETDNISKQNTNVVSDFNNSEILNSNEASQNIKPQGISQSDLENIQQQDTNVKYQVSDIDVEQTTYIEKTENIDLSQIEIMAIIWSIGVLICISIFIISNIRFRRLLQRDRKLLTEYCKGKCKVYKTNKVSTPCLYGVLVTAIYIPEIVLHKLSETDIEQILEHENRHYIHKDHLWSFVRCLLVSVYRFHPLVWVAAKLSKKDAELFCDESILAHKNSQERVQYGEMLLNVARVCNKTSMLYPITAVHSGKKEMKKRIVFIGKNKKYYKIIAILLFVIILIGSLITFTARKEEEKKEEKKTKDYTVTSVVERINSFDVTIPHVEGPDTETEEYLNKTIRKRIINIVKEFNSEGTIYYFEYSIENKTEEILSILIQYDYMAKGAAHPYVNAFAINIDIKNKKIITIDKVINRHQVEFAVKNNYLKKVNKNGHGIEGKGTLEEEETIELFDEIGNNKFYISDGKVGLIYDLIYARGSYEILETEDMRIGDYGVIQYMNIWNDCNYTDYKITKNGGEETYVSDVYFSLYELEEEYNAPGTIYVLELTGFYEEEILGYIYYHDNKIYKLNSIEEIEADTLIPNDYVVCQMENMEDPLDENEKGWHRSIEVKEDTIEYYSYNNQVETGYYEKIIWKKNVGIAFYESGYGAGRDSIKLELIDDKQKKEYQKLLKTQSNINISDFQVIEDMDANEKKDSYVMIGGLDENDNYECQIWHIKEDKKALLINQEQLYGDMFLVKNKDITHFF